jgi:hypothetical protein
MPAIILPITEHGDATDSKAFIFSHPTGGRKWKCP